MEKEEKRRGVSGWISVLGEGRWEGPVALCSVRHQRNAGRRGYAGGTRNEYKVWVASEQIMHSKMSIPIVCCTS